MTKEVVALCWVHVIAHMGRRGSNRKANMASKNVVQKRVSGAARMDAVFFSEKRAPVNGEGGIKGPSLQNVRFTLVFWE